MELQKVGMNLTVLAIGIAGAMGALLRYSVDLAMQEWWSGFFPLATFVINCAGCAVLGWFSVKAANADRMPEWFRLGFGTGLIGAFTTFSTFSMETVELIQQGRIGTAVLYMLLSMWGGLLFAWIGHQLADRQPKKAARSVSRS